jgi:hypothetical protein
MRDDPLLGCRLKLQGAWRHRQALGEELQEFLARTDPEPSPLHLGVIVGDFLHNLRCVLDHLVWQLVLLNRQEPGEHNQFPIFDTPDAYKKKAGRYLRGVAADHRALIETFQPYHLGADASSHYLAVLHDLSNIDKHRFVHPVVIHGEGDTREVRFTELEVTTNALFRMEHYVTYSLFRRFEGLFPLPAHAVDNVIANAVHDAIETGMDLSGRRPEAALVGAIANADSLRKRRSIAAWLNARGARSARGRLFGKDTGREMLCNAAYVGYVSGLRDKSRTIRGLHEAIVSDELFGRVQEVRSWRIRVLKPGPPSDEYLLRKLLYCERCGSRMHGTRGSKTATRRYMCSTRRYGHACGERIIKADQLETQIIDWIAGFQPQGQLFDLLPQTLKAADEQSASRPESDAGSCSTSSSACKTSTSSATSPKRNT